MIDIYLCEDQAEQLRCLEKWISGYIEKNGTEARVVSARTHPEETLEDLSPGSTQLFFIDIQLDNAIEAAEDCDPEGAVYIRLDQTDRGVMIRVENTYKEKPELSKMYEKGWSTKGEGRGNGLYRTKEMIEKQENLYHQCRIGDGRVMQTLEIEQQE